MGRPNSTHHLVAFSELLLDFLLLIILEELLLPGVFAFTSEQAQRKSLVIALDPYLFLDSDCAIQRAFDLWASVVGSTLGHELFPRRHRESFPKIDTCKFLEKILVRLE